MHSHNSRARYIVKSKSMAILIVNHKGIAMLLDKLKELQYFSAKVEIIENRVHYCQRNTKNMAKSKVVQQGVKICEKSSRNNVNS